MIFVYFFGVIVAALLPALIWLFFFMREDIHPEPRRLVIYTFCLGALMSLPVLALQAIFKNVAGANMIFLIVGLALIEEFFKFFAAFASIHKEPAFDEPIDAMIYMIVAALGFATVENLFVIGGNLSMLTLSSWSDLLRIILLRFVGATLLHALTSAMVGYYWARGHLKGAFIGSVALGLLIATFIHAIFNALIMAFQEQNLLYYASFFLVLISFFIFNDFEKLKFSPKANPPSGTLSVSSAEKEKTEN